MKVEYIEDEKALLKINPVEIEDEATYKCEITYLEVLENCDVVQLIKLKTLVKPKDVRLLHNGQDLSGPYLGPYNEGRKVEVTCEAIGGRPIPDVKWYNGSTEIKSKYTPVDNGDGTGTGVAKLDLVLSRGDLQAKFECKVESAALDEPIIKSFNADVNVRPTGIKLYGVDGPVTQGTNVKLRCDVAGAKPPAEVKWYNKSNLITDSKLISTEPQVMSDGTYTTKSTLGFQATRWENGNSFECRADNEVIRDQKESDLFSILIIDVEYPPVVAILPTNITKNETEETILRCTYTSNPMALLGIVWKKDGQNLTISEDKYEGGTAEDLVLVIKNTTRDDMGEYKCVCRNKVGISESENSTYLNVQYTPNVEVKMDPATPVRAEDKGNVTLFCEVNSGNPNTLSKVKWFLNDELILELPECNYTSYDDDGNGEGYGGPYCGIDSSVLVLLNVSETFAGNYSCQGKNVVGWGPMSDDQELIVYYPPKGTKLRSTPTKIVKKSAVTLHCSVEKVGMPDDVTYEWYRGSHLVPEVNTANWTIVPVTLETKSNFTCIAKNAGGSSQPASLSLDVLAPPAFIQNLIPYQGILMSSENISLTCRVECYPLCKINWFKDEQRITMENNKYRVKEVFHPPDTNKNDFQSVESTLIWNLQNWPGGQLDKTASNSYYTCQSTRNEVGSGVNSTIEIAVDYPPDNLTATPRVVKVKEHHRPEEIICNGKGHPQLSYTWKGEDSEKVLSTTNKLSLKAVARADSGKYICEASNKHGSNTTIAYIEVQYVPECTLETAEQDGRPTLVCTARANPQIVTFTFRIKGDNDSVDNTAVTVAGLKGSLPLDSGIDTFRTYQCFVTNEVGVSAPCERDVAGTVSWWKQFANENLIILIAVAIAIIICIIIICIIIIVVCRRKRANNKLPNQSSMGDKGGLGGIPPGGGTGDPLNDPDKLFYENLPFHGMQNPPNKPISIITPIVHTNANRRIQIPTSPSWASNQNTLNSNLQNRPKITRNKSFHGFQSNPSLNHSQGLSSTNLSNAVSTHQLPVHQFSQQDLTNIKFSSPIFSTLPHNYSSKPIRTNPNMNRSTTSMTSFLSKQPLNASNPFLTQPLGRVVGRNEHKLDIRRTASGINDYEKPKEQPKIEPKETKPKKEIGRFGSLELRSHHRCYSPTFYSMRCKKHSKRKSMIYAILKRPKSASVSKSSSIKSSKSEPTSTDYQNLTDSIQIFEQSADNIENEQKDQPRPAPRCKKHRKTEIVYANISKTLRDGAETNMDSSNNSSVHDPEVSVTEAIVHETPNKEDAGKPKKPEEKQKIETKTCRIINAPRPQVIEFAKKSPIPNLKVTPTVKVSPNFIKPKTESPKGALYMQLQARLKNSPNQTLQPATNSVPPFNRSKVKKAPKEDEKAPDPKQKPIPEIMSVPKMPILDPELTMRKNNALNAQNAFYTLTTPHYKQATKSPTPQQYSTIPHHPKHMKLIPRSLFQDQQISKSKSFSSKAKPKKHFQIPLQKCHSFKFQTAESYFQPIKNIHEENLMRNGYGAEMAPSYHHENHHGRNHKKDKHKSQHKGPLVVRRPNDYQENVQFQENMQNSVQLQYPQPVVGRAPNGVVYADLDMPKPGSIKQYAESTMSLTKHQTQKNKPKTEYATLKFNDIGQEIDV